jgi:hypothetical protein
MNTKSDERSQFGTVKWLAAISDRIAFLRLGCANERRFALSKKNTPLILAILLFSAVQQSNAQFSFVPGDYYSSAWDSPVITQYTPSGAVVGSLSVHGTSSVEGTAFGPDGLLYATTDQGSGFSVLALNSTGAVQQSYSAPVYVEGNIDFGQIAVNSQYLYVAGQNQVTEFPIGQPNSASAIYQNNQIFGLALTPGGNLFVASAYQIQEITPSGAVVETVPGNFVDLRGIAYDPTSNSVFVTELGETGSYFLLLRLNATTGAVQASTSFAYGQEVSLAPNGRLLVGSWTQPAKVFDENLNPIETLGNEQEFVTADEVPEPSVGLLMGFWGLLFGLRFVFCRKSLENVG